MVVVMPTSWDELAEYVMLGLSVNTFTWDEAMACLANPQWSFIHIITTTQNQYLAPMEKDKTK